MYLSHLVGRNNVKGSVKTTLTLKLLLHRRTTMKINEAISTVNREIFVFKNLRVINFRVKKSSSASGSNEDFLTTKFF